MQNLQELTRVCCSNAIYPTTRCEASAKRLLNTSARFHNDSRIPLQADYEGIVLMSAHQPTSCLQWGRAQGGARPRGGRAVARETWLSVVSSLFADQDFADEAVVPRTQLPSVRNRNGTLTLHLPVAPTYYNKLMRVVPKPDRDELARLKSDIERWASESFDRL